MNADGIYTFCCYLSSYKTMPSLNDLFHRLTFESFYSIYLGERIVEFLLLLHTTKWGNCFHLARKFYNVRRAGAS